MHKLFLVFLLFFTPLIPLKGSDYLLIEDEGFFGFKFVHPNEHREAFLTFSSYNESIDEDILFYEAVDSLSEKYGERFWEKMNFSNTSLETIESCLLWAFSWHQEDSLENVYVCVLKNPANPANCSCILLVEKGLSDNFDIENSTQGLVEDLKQLIDFSHTVFLELDK